MEWFDKERGEIITLQRMIELEKAVDNTISDEEATRNAKAVLGLLIWQDSNHSPDLMPEWVREAEQNFHIPASTWMRKD